MVADVAVPTQQVRAHTCDGPHPTEGMRRPWTKLQFPKEHGAWAMWIVPYVMGVLTAKETRWSHLALGVGFFLAFLGQPAVRSSLRAGRAPRSPVFWGQMLAAVPLIAIPMIQGKGMLGLFCFSAFEVGLIAGLLPWLELGQQKSVPARLLSVALLTSNTACARSRAHSTPIRTTPSGTAGVKWSRI